MNKNQQNEFVSWFRHSSPYIHAHRGKTFVIYIGGEAIQQALFNELVHDLGLLHALGIKLVIVHGARPQIEKKIKEKKGTIEYHKDLRVTDEVALEAVKEAAGSVRVEIEAQLSKGLAHTPMANAQINVVSGNFITARPMGILDGVDYHYTGQVRKVNTATLQQQLDAHNVVLISPVGYSPTGECFNLSSEIIATKVATALQADKLIYLVDPAILPKGKSISRAQTTHEARTILNSKRKISQSFKCMLEHSMIACTEGVRRAHIIDQNTDGSLLLELFTLDGVGYLVTNQQYEGLRPARIDDVAGILELIGPHEERGLLVRRSREILETEIENFSVIERDGLIVGCAALYAFPEEKTGELACMAIHPDYQNGGRGQQLLDFVEQQAKQQHLESLIVLTTQSAHWFRERGFKPIQVEQLPVKKKQTYNYQRKSRAFQKTL